MNGISWSWWALSLELSMLLGFLPPVLVGRAVLDHEWQLPRGEAPRRALRRLLARWLAATAMVTTTAVIMPVSYFPRHDLRLMVAATSAHVVMFTVFGVAQLFAVSKALNKVCG
ncbi:MAG TPA: hypothetical protein VER04_18475 [Polyangiaceae bacterium]|nr:hypothetical protein [Polyangiaceae bacterium]